MSLQLMEGSKIALQSDGGKFNDFIITYSIVGSGIYKTLVYTKLPPDVFDNTVVNSFFRAIGYHAKENGRDIEMFVRDRAQVNLLAEKETEFGEKAVDCLGGTIVELDNYMKCGGEVKFGEKVFQVIPPAGVQVAQTSGLSDLGNFRNIDKSYDRFRKAADENDSDLKKLCDDLSQLSKKLTKNIVIDINEQIWLKNIVSRLKKWSDSKGILEKIVKRLEDIIAYAENNLLNYLDLSVYETERLLHDHGGTSFEETAKQLRSSPNQNHTIAPLKYDRSFEKLKNKSYCHQANCGHAIKHHFRCGECTETKVGIQRFATHLSFHVSDGSNTVDFAGIAFKCLINKTTKKYLEPGDFNIKRIFVS